MRPSHQDIIQLVIALVPDVAAQPFLCGIFKQQDGVSSLTDKVWSQTESFLRLIRNLTKAYQSKSPAGPNPSRSRQDLTLLFCKKHYSPWVKELYDRTKA